MAVELAEIDVNDRGVEKSHKTLSEKSIEGVSVAVEIVGMVFEADDRGGARGRIEESCDYSAAFFLGGEASDQGVGTSGYHQGRAIFIEGDCVRLSDVRFGPNDNAIFEVCGVD